MKIRTKYLGFLCLFIFMFTGLILGVILHMKRLNTKNVKEMLSYQCENEMMYALEISLHKLIMPPNDYLIHGHKDEKHAFEDLVANVNRQFEILEGKHYSTRIMVEERELLARLKDKYTLVISLAEKILDIPNPIGSEEGAGLMEEMDLLVDNMTEEAKELNRKTYHIVLMKVGDIDAQFHRYMIIVLCILVVIIVSTALYGLFLTKGIVIPIGRIVEYTGFVGEGNLDRRLDIKRGDEIGTLAESLNVMTQRLKTSQVTIKEHTDKLEEMLGERTQALKDAIEKLKMTVEGIINTLALTVEQRDPYTAGHQQRVSLLSCAIAVRWDCQRIRLKESGWRELSMI